MPFPFPIEARVVETALRRIIQRGGYRPASASRSKSMSAIPSRGNRTTELRFAMALVRSRVRGWRLNARDVIGKPDFFFPLERLAVFCDGCFWHGCERCGHIPRRNHQFWAYKISRNRQRDCDTNLSLAAQEFGVLRLWEHELREDLTACVLLVQARLDQTGTRVRSRSRAKVRPISSSRSSSP